MPVSPWCVPLLVLPMALLWAWPRRVEQDYSTPRTQIRIVEGDLFRQTSHIIANMTTTFDTKTPDLVSAASVQGQLLSRVYNGDRDALDADLAVALAPMKPSGTIEKPGKTDLYPVGTVAPVWKDGRFFFCVALSEMNETNVAHASVDGLWSSLTTLWETVRSRSNGQPTAIPVVGGGQSKLSHVVPAQDAIRLIALTFMLASRQGRICERLDIVVEKKEVKHVNFPELQSFLKAMREC